MKRNHEKEKVEKLKALKVEYDAKIAKLNKQLEKSKKDQVTWKLKS